MRRSEWTEYLDWTTTAFRLAASGASSQTQVHTYMCYAEFDNIIEAIEKLDADVISLETARSHMAVIDSFAQFAYQNQVGPGAYDIHYPNIPTVVSMTKLLERALTVAPHDQLWVNPDCGLKTRNCPKIRSVIEAMILAAKGLRRGHALQESPV